MKFKLEPAPGKVIVEPDPKYNSEIITVITSGRSNGTIGTIIAVYEPFIKPEEAQEEIETESIFKAGDRVIFGPHSGVEISIERSKYICMRESEILTKIIELEEKLEITAGLSEYDDLEE